jgi:hypothetical protein
VKISGSHYEHLVEVVSSHEQRAVVRAGNVFLKVETDTARAAAEREAMTIAPVPTPALLWWHDGPPALYVFEAVAGTSLAKLGEPSPHPATAWKETGLTVRALHDAPIPPRSYPPPAAWRDFSNLSATIDEVAAWLHANTAVPADVVEARASYAHATLDDRAFEPAFVHGTSRLSTSSSTMAWSQRSSTGLRRGLAILSRTSPH